MRQGATNGSGLPSKNHKRTNGSGNGSGNGRGRKSAESFHSRERGRQVIAVFGSSRARRGDELFEQGVEMGRLLGKNGYDVMTGGYTGVMEAVSQGAHEAGARVLGITMVGFEDRANTFVMDELHTPNFYVRFKWLIDGADGFIAMRGGMGTLAEMTFAWQKLSLRMFAERPLILLGSQWQAVLEVWAENFTIIPDDYRGLTVAATPQKACEAIRAFFEREDAIRHPGLERR